jgi:AbiU2
MSFFNTFADRSRIKNLNRIKTISIKIVIMNRRKQKKDVPSVIEPINQNHVDVLVRECDILKSDWQLYQDLFTQGPARADTLNKISPAFFLSVHRNLVLSLILRISKLTDPVQTFSQDNLTMQSLLFDWRR